MAVSFIGGGNWRKLPTCRRVASHCQTYRQIKHKLYTKEKFQNVTKKSLKCSLFMCFYEEEI
jgi:hypothetical protein